MSGVLYLWFLINRTWLLETQQAYWTLFARHLLVDVVIAEFSALYGVLSGTSIRPGYKMRLESVRELADWDYLLVLEECTMLA